MKVTVRHPASAVTILRRMRFQMFDHQETVRCFPALRLFVALSTGHQVDKSGVASEHVRVRVVVAVDHYEHPPPASS